MRKSDQLRVPLKHMTSIGRQKFHQPFETSSDFHSRRLGAEERDDEKGAADTFLLYWTARNSAGGWQFPILELPTGEGLTSVLSTHTKKKFYKILNTSVFFFKVYWTVYHLDSWTEIDKFDVICFIISLFTAQHVSNVSTSIFRSLRLIVDLFNVLYCSGSMCVGVMVWFGWGGVVSLCRVKH